MCTAHARRVSKQPVVMAACASSARRTRLSTVSADGGIAARIDQWAEAVIEDAEAESTGGCDDSAASEAHTGPITHAADPTTR